MIDIPRSPAGPGVIHYRPATKGQAVTRQQFLEHLARGDHWLDTFVQVLVDCPFTAYRIEMPACAGFNKDADAEFVLIDSPMLVRESDAQPFSSYFDAASQSEQSGLGIVNFSNLGGDAQMVVPLPGKAPEICAHLGRFMREASPTRQRDLWGIAAAEMLKKIEQQTCWLNTHGGGVAWVHVRIDRQPKYYSYAPYRNVHYNVT